MKSNEEVILE